MRVTRIYTGDDGRSHFEDIDVATGAGGTQRSPDFPATAVGLRESDGARDLDFHHAPRRQLVVVLAGRLEIEVGDGTKREFGPGEMFLADDTSGQGHILRDIGGPAPRRRGPARARVRPRGVPGRVAAARPEPERRAAGPHPRPLPLGDARRRSLRLRPPSVIPANAGIQAR